MWRFVGFIIKTDITQIRMFLIEHTQDLNVTFLNEELDYHIILEFKPIGGYLHQLNSKIRGQKFYNINIVHDPNGWNLIEALKF